MPKFPKRCSEDGTAEQRPREIPTPSFIPVEKKPNGKDRNESTDLTHDQPLNLGGWLPLPYTGKKAMHGDHGTWTVRALADQ
jgi:hypothetical protein